MTARPALQPVGAPPGVHDIVWKWAVRCPTPPSMRTLLAASAFVQRAKRGGWWSLFPAMYFFAGINPTIGQQILNVVSASYTLTPSGTLYTTANGVTSDGSTGQLDTGLTPAAAGQTASLNGIIIYVQHSVFGLAADAGATPVSNQIAMSSSRNAFSGGIWNCESLQLVISNRSGLGLCANIRTDVNGGFWCHDGVIFPWSAPTSGSLPTSTYRFLTSGISAAKTLNTLAFGMVCGSVPPTAGQCIDISGACDDYLAALDLYIDRPAPEIVLPPHAFLRSSVASVTPPSPPRRIFKITTPPLTDADNFLNDYPAGPLTDCLTRPWSVDPTTTQTQVGVHEFLWSDRGLGPTAGVITSWAKNPNDTMGVIVNSQGNSCRTQFLTFLTAIGSTLTKLMWTLGATATRDPAFSAVSRLLFQYGFASSDPGYCGFLDAAKAFGYNTTPWNGLTGANLYTDVNIATGNLLVPSVWHRAYAAANADLFFTHSSASGNFRVSNDQIILGQARLWDLPVKTGVALDYEMDDNRNLYTAPDGVTDLLTATTTLLSAAVRSRGLIIGALTDPLSASGQHLGLTPANVAANVGALDYINILFSFNPPGGDETAFLQAQWDFYRNAGITPDKIMLQAAIGGPGQELKLAYAQAIHDFAVSNGFRWFILFGGFGAPGGALTRQYNQVLATLLGLPTS